MGYEKFRTLGFPWKVVQLSEFNEHMITSSLLKIINLQYRIFGPKHLYLPQILMLPRSNQPIPASNIDWQIKDNEYHTIDSLIAYRKNWERRRKLLLIQPVHVSLSTHLTIKSVKSTYHQLIDAKAKRAHEYFIDLGSFSLREVRNWVCKLQALQSRNNFIPHSSGLRTESNNLRLRAQICWTLSWQLVVNKSFKW